MYIAIGRFELEVMHSADYKKWFVYLRAGSREWHRELGYRLT